MHDSIGPHVATADPCYNRVFGAEPDEGDATMKKGTPISLVIAVSTAVLAAGVAISAQDKYTLQVPNGLAFL